MTTSHQTPSGIAYTLLGKPAAQPAPALFVFATDAETTLTDLDFNQIGHRLLPHGVLGISLTLPCHGEDQRPDEPFGLEGWRARLENNEPIFEEFTAKARAVLDHLINEGTVDANRVAVCGTSRGGFIALHFTATEPRVKATVAFAPVTDLMALHEFNGLEDHPPVRSSRLFEHAAALAHRSFLISIGNADLRVDTDSAIAFARRAAALAANPDVVVDIELHVTPAIDHYTATNSHQVAAAWIARRIGIPVEKL